MRREEKILLRENGRRSILLDEILERDRPKENSHTRLLSIICSISFFCPVAIEEILVFLVLLVCNLMHIRL